MTIKSPTKNQIIETGPSIGTYRDKNIPAWIKAGDDTISDYVSIIGDEIDLTTLKPNQSVIFPGLLYEERAPESKPESCGGCQQWGRSPIMTDKGTCGTCERTPQQITPSLNLNHCPFCGSDCINDSTVTTKTDDDGETTFWFVCPDCAAVSPPGLTFDEAVNAWNTRSQPKTQ